MRDLPTASPSLYLNGKYVITGVQNAFNEKTSYWISKKGFTISAYCFTADKPEEVEYQIKHGWPGYIKNLESYIKNLESGLSDKAMKSVMLWDDDFSEIDWKAVCEALDLPVETQEVELKALVIASFPYKHGRREEVKK